MSKSVKNIYNLFNFNKNFLNFIDYLLNLININNLYMSNYNYNPIPPRVWSRVQGNSQRYGIQIGIWTAFRSDRQCQG